MRKQQGSALVVILVIVILVSVIGFVGYRVYKNNSSTNSETAQSVTVEQKEITSSQDVTTAQNELDSINLDSDLDASVLNEDISDLQ